MEDIFDLDDNALVSFKDLNLDPGSEGADAISRALGNTPWRVSDVKKFLNGVPMVPDDSVLYPLSLYLEDDLNHESLVDFLSTARQLQSDTSGDVHFLLQSLEKVASAAAVDEEALGHGLDELNTLDPSLQKRKMTALLNQVSELQEQVDELAAQNEELQDSARHNAAAEKRLEELEETLNNTEMQRTKDEQEIKSLKKDLNASRDTMLRLKQQKANLEDENSSKDVLIETLERQAATESALGLPNSGSGTQGAGNSTTTASGRRGIVSRGVTCHLPPGHALVKQLCVEEQMCVLQVCMNAWRVLLDGHKSKDEMEEMIKARVERELRERFEKELEEKLAAAAVRFAGQQQQNGGPIDKEREMQLIREKEQEKREWERREWQLKQDLEQAKIQVMAEKEKAQSKEQQRLEQKMESERMDWERGRQRDFTQQDLNRELSHAREQVSALEKEKARLEEEMKANALARAKEMELMKEKENANKAKEEPAESWNKMCLKTLNTEKHRQFVQSLQKETEVMKDRAQKCDRACKAFSFLIFALGVPTLHLSMDYAFSFMYPLNLAM